MIRPSAGLAHLQPPCLRPDLHHRDRPRVVDVDRRLRQPVARRGEARPVVGRELARAQALRLDLRLRAHEALRDLGLRHLEREQRHGRLAAHGEVRRHAEREARLSHARPRGEDDEVPGLEAGRQLVEVAEAARDAGDVGPLLVERGDALEARLQQLLDVAEVARRHAPARGRRSTCSARSTSSVVSAGRSMPSRVISLPARIRPRSVAISRTMRA